MEEIKDKYQQAIASFSVPTDDAVIAQEVSQLHAQHVDENRKNEVYQFMLNCIDLTTLSSTDTQ